MARSFTVSYKFKAIDAFSATSKKINKNNKKLSNSTKKLSKEAEKLAKKNKKLAKSFKILDFQATKAGRAINKTSGSFARNAKIMAAAAIAFIGIKKMITVASEFEDALADLSAITGAVGKDLDMLKQKTFEMARASITSQADVAKGIKLVASAKPELLKNLPLLAKTTDAVLLLKNTGIDLESAVAATVGGLNAFGEGAEFAARNVNILAAGSKLGSSEVRETAEALKLAGPGAKAAGLTFLDLNVAIQALAKAGIKGSQGGTALNAMFARLQLSGKDFRKLGLAGVFKLVSKEIKAIKDPTARATAEFGLFGLEHAKSGLAMLDNIAVIEELSISMKGTDAAAEQARIRMRTFSQQIKLTGIIIDEKLIKLVGFAKTGLDLAGASIRNFVEGFDPADIEAFGIILGGIGSIVAGLGQIFKVVFNIIMTVINPVIAILKGLGIVFAKIAASVVTGSLVDFGGFDALQESFSLGGKFLGVFGEGDKPGASVGEEPGTPVGAGGDTSRTDINMNINAPEGVIQSIQSKTSGGRATNVGVNMAAG